MINMNPKPAFINISGRLINLSVPKVMGILNVTPDSFYNRSRYISKAQILEAAEKMLTEGADFLDIGGYSSRPGAEDISLPEERERVIKAIKLVSSKFPEAVISVDTFRSEIAKEAITDAGAHIINDITGGDGDEGMFSLVAELNVPYIIMHMQGTPGTMQINPVYDDVVADILKWMGERIVKLHAAGVKDIIIDPGIGFGKTRTHNFELIRRLDEFSVTGLPLLVGLSRKSLVWKTLGITPEEALNGTSVLNAAALLKGADILRVHDVKEAVETVKLLEKIGKHEHKTA